MTVPAAFEALYLHIPFCKAKCLYCDFDSRAFGGCALRDELEAYLTGLIELVRRAGGAGHLSNVKTVYIGGGTPSLAGTRLGELMAAVTAYCAPMEVTCEANPESFSLELASILADSGVTRISLGVQSLQDDELHAIGRIHSAYEALDAISLALAAGFHVSCDLMCGLPHQSLESWESTLDVLLSQGNRPHHVSVYPLQLEEGTPLERLEAAGKIVVPDEDFQAECMEVAQSRLSALGYGRYEVASYAMPGCACLHNIAYWTGKSYLGLGRSAAGMVDRGERGRVRFIQRDDIGGAFEREHLDAREAAAEDLMLACRMARGVSAELIGRASIYIPRQEIDAACASAVELGLARWEDGGLIPTQLGWLEGNRLFGIFWDLAR